MEVCATQPAYCILEIQKSKPVSSIKDVECANRRQAAPLRLNPPISFIN